MNEICDKYGAKYIRFADDQIIYAKDLHVAKNILFEASRELLKINLNFNSSKVKEFKSKADFDTYWAFELFELLKNKTDKAAINSSIDKYFEYLDTNVKFRDNSVLKRILSVDSKLIEPKYRHRLIAMFFNPDFLAQLTVWHFKRIREFIDNDTEFFGELDKMVSTVPFNSYHYNLLAFYKKERTGFDCSAIEKRIEEIKLK
jgi:hypothetical protein